MFTVRTERPRLVVATTESDSVAIQLEGAPAAAVAPSSAPASVAASAVQQRRGPPRGPRWEVGGAAGGRFSGAFAGLAVLAQGRVRLRSLPLYLGVDVGGRYSKGDAGVPLELAGLAVHGTFDARLELGRRVELVIGVLVGGAVLTGHTDDLQQRPVTDGGPTVGVEGAVAARLGPGQLSIALGFEYTPLVGHRNTNVDGGAVTVAYRYARW
jgi:hypothetical protein